MSYYVYIYENGATGSIIPEIDPDFPGIPITERFSSDFLASCVTVEDPSDVLEMYNRETGEFYTPEPEPVPVITEPVNPPDPLEQLRLDMYSRFAEVGYELALLKIGGGSDVV